MFKFHFSDETCSEDELDKKARDVFRSAHLIGQEFQIGHIDSVLKQTASQLANSLEKSSLANLKYKFPGMIFHFNSYKILKVCRRVNSL